MRWIAEKIRRRPALIQFFLSYLALILLFGAGILLAGGRFLSIIRENTAQNGMLELTRAADTFELRLDEMENLAYALANDKDVIAVAGLNSPPSTADHFQLVQLQNQISKYYQQNTAVETACLWFSKPQIAKIGDSFVTAQYDFFESQYLINGKRYQSFFEDFAASGRGRRLCEVSSTFLSSPEKALLYCMDLGIYADSARGIYLFVELAKTSSADSFSFFEDDADGGFCAVDAQGGPVMVGRAFPLEELRASHEYAAGGVTVQGDQFLQLEYRPPSGRYCYLLYISNRYFRKMMRGVLEILWFLMAALFVAGLGLALLFSYRNSLPLRRILDALKGNLTPDGEYESIHQSIEGLLHSQQDMRRNLEKQLQMRKNHFFNSLLWQNFMSRKELQEGFLSLGMTPHPLYTAVYVSLLPLPSDRPEFSKDHEQLSTYVILNRAFSESLPGLLHIYQHSNQNYTLFAGLPDASTGKLCGVLEGLCRMLRQSYRINVTCGVGVPCRELTEMPLCCRQARLAVEQQQPQNGEQVLPAAGGLPVEGDWQYSNEDERRLLLCCRHGDFDSAQKLVAGVLGSCSGSEDREQLVQLGYSFRATILRLLGEISGGELSAIAANSRRLTAVASAEELQESVLTILKNICLLMKKEEEGRKNRLYSAIFQYLRQNYSDQNLSLTSVADQFNISEKYLSHFFKEAGGENFSAVVERIRMEAIIGMMSSTAKPISDIALSCGYASSNSFYKAFKRVYQVTPNAYREMLGKQGDGPES